AADVDAAKLQRILINLLSNAFRFTPEGGEIRIALKARRKHSVLQIEDSGPGIPADSREKIFEPFHQLDVDPAFPHGGTGLGLTIVREFVKLHGGTVRVGESELGGALFTVEVPTQAPEHYAVEKAREEQTAVAATRSLVADHVKPSKPISGVAGPL